MRYAAVLAASAVVAGTLVFARDGRGEAAPEPAPAAVQAVPARVADARPGAAQEDFRWTGSLARGQQVQIQGIVGEVRAEIASGNQVEVVGRRSGRDADRVRIEAVPTEDGVVICAIYPSTGGGRGRGTCHGEDDDSRDEDEGHGGRIDGEHARVDFTVRVPAGVRFAARTVAGDVYASGLRSPVDVATVSGDVSVFTTGTARATSVSGDVTATFGETDGEAMEFASVSGDVVLRLAGNVNAQVSARTLSGDIRSDFDLRTSDDDDDEDDDEDDGGFHVRVGSEASGRIGRGGAPLSVNTVSGDIRLERAR